MSISSALNIALSGLTATGKLAEITSGNLANALTDGYGRQTVTLSSGVLGGLGNGVAVAGVDRASSPELTSARRIADGDDVGAATVFDPNLGGQKLAFIARGEEIVDEETGSTWNLFGQATSGPLEGKELSPIPHRGSQLWFSWAVFKPDTLVYRGKEAS